MKEVLVSLVSWLELTGSEAVVLVSLGTSFEAESGASGADPGAGDVEVISGCGEEASEVEATVVVVESVGADLTEATTIKQTIKAILIEAIANVCCWLTVSLDESQVSLGSRCN